MNTTTTIDLGASIRGELIAPGHPVYDQARTVVLGGIDRRPALIVRPADAEDVRTVILAAGRLGVELAVRSGGHSAAAHGVCQGGIVLDMRSMSALRIDPEGLEAWAGPGVSTGEYTAAAGTHGLATPFGDTGSVGVSGITLGGGIGYLVRRFGLTIDSLLEAEVVTAGGQVLHTDRDTHPDLFWAIRGGGGNFGVVTRLRFRLHPVGTVVGGMLVLPATAQTITGFMEAARNAPEQLSTIANVMPAPPMPFLPAEYHGRPVILATLVAVEDVEAGQAAVAPFRALAKPLADMVRPMTYPEVFMPSDPDYHPLAVSRTMFMDNVDTGEAAAMLAALEASDAPLRAVQLRALGGAMARVPSEATAFAHRGSRFMANVVSFCLGAEDRDRRAAWVAGLAGELLQTDRGAYVNFLADEGEQRVRQAYPGAAWDRLAQVKRRYDPGNIFRLNQNIPPAR
jgi:FAD/FMN-containing dehydrogenase